MQDHEQEQEQEQMQDQTKDQTQEVMQDHPDVVDDMEYRINELVDKFLQTELDHPDDIYNNNGLFVLMLKYIYKYYLVDILKNDTNIYSNRYDYKLLDKIFKIYTNLVYRYKKNSKPSVLEFCVFVRISKDNIYNAVKGYIKKLSVYDIDIIKTWFNECESSLVNGSSVFDIFLLKSQYGYNDNLQSVPLELQHNVLSADQLPDFSENVSRIEDKNTQQ